MQDCTTSRFSLLLEFVLFMVLISICEAVSFRDPKVDINASFMSGHSLCPKRLLIGKAEKWHTQLCLLSWVYGPVFLYLAIAIKPIDHVFYLLVLFNIMEGFISLCESNVFNCSFTELLCVRACAVLCILTLQSLPCKNCPGIKRLIGEVETLHSSAMQHHTCMHKPI